MGRLVNLSDLDLDATWYFPDAYYHRERNNYAYAWPNPAYPYSAAIHSDDLREHHKKVEIRKWVEECLSETVIVDILDKSYRRYTDEENSWDKSYQISNRWVVFYFEVEHSETMFRLKFSGWIKQVTDEHPRWL